MCVCLRVCLRARVCVCVGARVCAWASAPQPSMGDPAPLLTFSYFSWCVWRVVCVCVCVCVPQPWMGDILNQLEEGVARARRPGGGGGGEAAACLAMLVMGMRAYIYLCIELVK